MSRVAKAPVVIPAGVDVKISGQVITIVLQERRADLVLSTMLLKLIMQIMHRPSVRVMVT